MSHSAGKILEVKAPATALTAPGYEPTIEESTMGNRTCTVDGCQNKHMARGLCSGHYGSWMRTGTPEPPLPALPPLEERFWARVHRTETCWLWTGFISKRGYGAFANRAWGTGIAHRIAWILTKGPIPDGMTLDHLQDRCGNKHCVNPDHLELVTALENHRRWAAAISHCSRGHEFTEDSTYVTRQGWRRCRICRPHQRGSYG